jgi:cytochrome c oxidase subunit 2
VGPGSISACQLPRPQSTPARGLEPSRGRFPQPASGYVPPQVHDTRHEYGRLFDVYVPVAVVIFAIVLVATAFVVLRYRSSSREFPQNESSNTPVEISYVVLISLIAAALLVFTFNSLSDLAASESSARGPTIKVTGAKWNWRFDYPGYGVSELAPGRAIATLVVPVNTTVRFRLTSVDVIHSFWIPERRFKRDLFPGRVTTTGLRFPKQGFFRRAGECAQFCGLDHANMDFNLRVVSARGFRAWVARKRAGARS